VLVSALLGTYEADRAPVVADTTRLNTTITPLVRHLGARAVAGLDREAFAEYGRRRQADGVQPQTVRRELITLRAALRMAWKDGEIDRVPPIHMPPAGASRQRVLTPDETARLRRAVADDEQMQVCVDLLLGTGARLGAVMELSWDRVDFGARQIDFRAPHPRAARRKHRAVVPMPTPLASLLRRHQRRSGGDRVVALGRTSVERRFRAACQRAGLEGVTPHVLRHTVATHLLRRVRLVEASRYLGHKSVAITEQVYGHLTVGDLEPAARAAGSLLR
jgi:integrase